MTTNQHIRKKRYIPPITELYKIDGVLDAICGGTWVEAGDGGMGRDPDDPYTPQNPEPSTDPFDPLDPFDPFA